MAHRLVDLAREAIRAHLSARPRPAGGADPVCGVFVSLHDPAPPGGAEGRLRGCRGSVEPVGTTLEEEVMHQAVLSATADPRCDPVRPAEVDELDITVYLLGAAESVPGTGDLDPKRFGVIVTTPDRRRTALLLPAIPGIESAAEQVAIARRKAGIGAGEPVDLYRFAAEILR